MKTSVNSEMKKLSRAELLEIIYEMKKNEVKLQEMLTSAQEELKKKEILIDDSGSIAEASLKLNDMFGAAQRAADVYIESVKERYASIEKECTAAETKRQQLLDAARIQADIIVQQAKQKSAKMIESAEENIKEREVKFQQTVDSLINSYSVLKNLMQRNG